MVRTAQERAIDCLLTTYVIDDAFSRCELQSMPETMLQKLVFLSERSMIRERKKGFCFRFVKLKYGPFSQELKDSLGGLKKTGLVGSRLAPTPPLGVLLQDFRDVIERNKIFFQEISQVNDAYAGMSLRELLNTVYAMPWGKHGKTIKDLPLRTPMLYPMRPGNVKLEFGITAEEGEDLLMNFDLEAITQLQQAASDMREGRTRTYEQVFAGL